MSHRDARYRSQLISPGGIGSNWLEEGLPGQMLMINCSDTVISTHYHQHSHYHPQTSGALTHHQNREKHTKNFLHTLVTLLLLFLIF